MRLFAAATALFLFAAGAASADGVMQADAILIEKQKHTLTLFHEGTPIRTYQVSIGRGGPGPKIRQGDKKTPEGHYVISGRNAHSDFHRALKISYPNADDIARARKLGVSPGGNILIHGLPNDIPWIGKIHRLKDWTAGCIAVTDDEIDEIWKLVPDGTPVDIKP